MVAARMHSICFSDRGLQPRRKQNPAVPSQGMFRFNWGEIRCLLLGGNEFYFISFYFFLSILKSTPMFNENTRRRVFLIFSLFCFFRLCSSFLLFSLSVFLPFSLLFVFFSRSDVVCAFLGCPALYTDLLHVNAHLRESRVDACFQSKIRVDAYFLLLRSSALSVCVFFFVVCSYLCFFLSVSVSLVFILFCLFCASPCIIIEETCPFIFFGQTYASICISVSLPFLLSPFVCSFLLLSPSSCFSLSTFFLSCPLSFVFALRALSL